MNLRSRLRDAFRWRGDRPDEHAYADVTGWWRDPALFPLLGPALAELFPDPAPTVVVGPASRGSLLGPLVALHLGTGFVEARKDPGRAGDSDRWVRRTTPPDHRDRHLELGFRQGLIRAGDRVLAVDDWIDTGSQIRTVRRLVDDVGAAWLGVSCIVDGLDDARLRRDLNVRSLLQLRDL
ncbi:phosphoribosyltransferase family protein [Micromonosporaceae bacterium Da 78-11]